MTKNEKLKQSRLKKGLTQAELAVMLNVKQAYISGIETSQTFGIKKAEQIAKILEVDALWLYNDDIIDNVLSQNSNIALKENNKSTGYSNNLSDNKKPEFYKLVQEKPKLEAIPIGLHPHSDDDDSGNAKFVYAPDGTMGMRVSIVPGKAQAGYLLGFSDPEYYEDFETEIIPVEMQHKGTYLGFEVRGDSMMTTDPELMENNIYPGWRAIGKDLPKSKWAYKLHTHNYDNWIIVHRTEGILIKTIIKHDVEKGIITIHSLNPEYEDKELNLADIEQIFNVVQIVPKKRR
ncbi:helix-turn-helix domain-containing protein [Mucilaginibacter sp. 10I4]|uniref:LexA family transcriptional regulator n=1 Tax=Mucilaginibacter sp. 10I4 TaxID=3048580 RepID=UPI002B232EAB|nr:helix-turn-helix domain-containing protein [Mucilaginibacter sp. 10I4]MEB0262867.1 helix-turn-helix domain-containing protein [Mucilaginibacter sp. 10I4]